MDYEKKYKDALERARDVYTYYCDDREQLRKIESVFPELAESEDERMVKFIKQQLFNIKKTITDNYKLDTELTKAIDWLEKQCSQIPANSVKTCKDEQKSIKEHNVCDFCDEKASCISPCPTKLIEEQKPVDFSDLRTWKYIVDAVMTEKEGIGQYLDSPFTEEVAKKLQKRFGKIEQKPAETEKGVKGNFREIPFSEQKPAWSEEDKNRINRLIAYFEDKESFTAEDDVVYANWLKSLKDRYTWKPSKEQMLVLNIAIEMEDGDILKSLYQDLLKLKEE